MNDKRRFIIILASVTLGALLSIGLFYLRRQGNIQAQDYTTIVTNFVFALAIVVVVGVVFKGKKENKE
jgi:ABC-type Mn2+/Zn2+ transport system permease subunit